MTLEARALKAVAALTYWTDTQVKAIRRRTLRRLRKIGATQPVTPRRPRTEYPC